MVQINFALKEVNCKIVYYGPGMSGKTTNLEVVHRKAPIANKGELTSIATEGDRTLFFDFMPLDLGNIAGMRTKFQLYTVPGQVYYNSTRKLVLQGVDGIIFVADSQEDKMEENLESLENLRNNLAEYGKDLIQIPMVIQYNKRDLPNALDVEVLNEKLNPRKLPSFEGVATTGEGVFPTLKALSAMVLESLSNEKRGPGAPRGRRPGASPTTPAAKKPEREPVAAAKGSVPEEKARPAAASTQKPSPPKTGISDPALKEKVEAAQAQARERKARQAAMEASGAGASTGVDETDGARIRKGTSSFDTSPPEAPGGGHEKPAQPDGPARSRKPEPPKPKPSAPPKPDRVEAQPTSEERPRSWKPERQASRPPQPQAKPPMVQKFVLEEERGSPVLLMALGLIILVAVGVILYSFNVI